MAQLSDIEVSVLHEIIEGYEATGMSLYLLIYFVHFYFSPPESKITDIYQLTLDTLASLEKEGLILFVKQRYKRFDNNVWHLVSEDLVSKELVHNILNHPKTWSCNICYEDGEYLYIPTDEGIKTFNNFIQ
jgi:hypothetical protein